MQRVIIIAPSYEDINNTPALDSFRSQLRPIVIDGHVDGKRLLALWGSAVDDVDGVIYLGRYEPGKGLCLSDNWAVPPDSMARHLSLKKADWLYLGLQSAALPDARAYAEQVQAESLKIARHVDVMLNVGNGEAQRVLIAFASALISTGDPKAAYERISGQAAVEWLDAPVDADRDGIRYQVMELRWMLAESRTSFAKIIERLDKLERGQGLSRTAHDLATVHVPLLTEPAVTPRPGVNAPDTWATLLLESTSFRIAFVAAATALLTEIIRRLTGGALP